MTIFSNVLLNTFMLFNLCQLDASVRNDSLQFEEEYQQIFKKGNVIPIKQTEKKFHQLLFQMKEREEASTRTVKVKCWLELLNINGALGNYDSIPYYKENILKNADKPIHLGKLYQYLSRVENAKANFELLLEYSDKALGYYKEVEDPYYSDFFLIELLDFYPFSSKETRSEIISILEQRYNALDVKPIIKLKIRNRLVKFLLSEDKYEPALDLLKKTDTSSFSSNRYERQLYFSSFSSAYLGLKQYDSAIITLKSGYTEKGFIIGKRNEILKYLKLAKIYFEKGEYRKAKYYTDQIEAFGIMGINELELKISFLKLKYRLSKISEDWKSAHNYFNEITKIEELNYTTIQKKQTAIIRHRLKKDQDLKRLEYLRQQEKLSNIEEIKSLILITLIIIISLILLFVSIYLTHKRKNLETKMALKHQKEVSSLKNTFIQNLSHEFRTPINIIIGYFSLIKTRTFQPEKAAEYANIGIKKGNELVETLNNFLTILRAEENQETLRRDSITSLEMREFIYNVVNSFSIISELHNISLRFSSNIQKKTPVEFNYDYLQKILENLISNAIKFSKSDSSVYVTANIADNQLHLLVKDEGVGILKNEQSLIFDRFFQSEKNKSQGGFGIGLSLVKQLTNDLNGKITVSSKLNIGTIFKTSLPLILETPELYISNENSDSFEKIEIPINLALIDSDSKDDSKKELPKILIIDDSLEMGKYLQEILSPFAKCSYTFNGNEGLLKVKNEKFDLIISDYKMPICDGFQFKKALNNIESYNTTPFLIMSGFPIDFGHEENIKLKINEYILKPFSETEIIARVKILLENHVYIDKLFDVNEKNKNLIPDEDFAKLMVKINKIILGNLKNQNFNVKKLAKEVGLSETKLYRLIKSKTSNTPVQIILEIRLLKSYELIKNQSKKTLDETMYEVGIHSKSYFRKVFLKRFGIKPGEMFKKHKT
ncbi:ATP-binding protein [uncultured Kordia sp.]|uniref:ATP-binding protein n=1 Tax=uncultured Kordia sp. TaxID=507699 RepID=UPI002624F3C4|nr:ATP-binding protein [uncultured Kordia sp.]